MTTHSGAREPIDPAVSRIATVLIIGGLAVVFDTTIVSVALHTMAVQLGTTVATIQWVSTAYLLALGVTIPLVGWAQSRFGGKRLWMCALVLFLIGSIACSVAWNAPSLIAFRVVQGVGGGVMLPLMATLVMQAAGGRAVGRTMARVSLPAVLGPVFGPVLGGVILNWFDWRWLFWVNVPFCVVGLALAWTQLPPDGHRPRIRLDVFGALLLSPGLVGLLYGLSNAGTPAGFTTADVLAPLITGGALLVAFGVYSTRPASSALVDVRLLGHRSVAASSGLLLLSGAALYGGMLLLPLSFQELRGVDPLIAGLLLVPQGVGTFFSRTIAGRLMDSIGAKWVALAGFAIVGLATIPFAVPNGATNEWVLMAFLVLRGFGLGAVTVPVMAVAFVGLRPSDVPHASILTRIAQQIGGSFGVALLAVILEGFTAAGDGSAAATAAAFHQAFWWSIVFTAIATVGSLALPGRPSQVTARRRTSG